MIVAASELDCFSIEYGTRAVTNFTIGKDLKCGGCHGKVQTNIQRLVVKLEVLFKNGRNVLYKYWTSALKNGKISLS